MIDISEKDILYRPKLEPEKDYRSEAEIARDLSQDIPEQIEETIPQLEAEINSIIDKANQLSNILDVDIPIFKNVKNNLIYISDNLSKMKGFETSEELNNKDLSPQEPVIERSEESKAFLMAIYGRIPEPVIVIGDPDTTKYIESSKNMDLLKVYSHYVDFISRVFNEFYREALALFVESGFESVSEMFEDIEIDNTKEYENEANIEPIVHRMHMAKIMRDQKSKILDKIFNINKTVKHLVTIETTNELRKKYYSIKPVV